MQRSPAQYLEMCDLLGKFMLEVCKHRQLRLLDIHF